MPSNLNSEATSKRPTWNLIRAHVSIARLDHSVKNIFILPGIVIPLSLGGVSADFHLLQKVILGILAATLISSSNYVLNELLDAPYDRLHPSKKTRPVARGLVSIPFAYIQWLAMMVGGLMIALRISSMFAASVAALWIMGCAYNIRPIRAKDVPYVDALTESVNNPLRLLQGWYMVTTTLVPPISLLVAYWMVGAYLMALKRFSELRQFNDREIASSYRKSFKYYTETSLLVSVIFYSSAAMMFFGAFVMRYRVELVFSFPFVALVMAIYFFLAFQAESAVQHPEKLYQEPVLMCAVAACVLAMAVLLQVDLPWMDSWFSRTLPNRGI